MTIAATAVISKEKNQLIDNLAAAIADLTMPTDSSTDPIVALDRLQRVLQASVDALDPLPPSWFSERVLWPAVSRQLAAVSNIVADAEATHVAQLLARVMHVHAAPAAGVASARVAAAAEVLAHRVASFAAYGHGHPALACLQTVTSSFIASTNLLTDAPSSDTAPPPPTAALLFVDTLLSFLRVECTIGGAFPAHPGVLAALLSAADKMAIAVAQYAVSVHVLSRFQSTQPLANAFPTLAQSLNSLKPSTPTLDLTVEAAATEIDRLVTKAVIPAASSALALLAEQLSPPLAPGLLAAAAASVAAHTLFALALAAVDTVSHNPTQAYAALPLVTLAAILSSFTAQNPPPDAIGALPIQATIATATEAIAAADAVIIASSDAVDVAFFRSVCERSVVSQLLTDADHLVWAFPAVTELHLPPVHLPPVSLPAPRQTDPATDPLASTPRDVSHSPDGEEPDVAAPTTVSSPSSPADLAADISSKCGTESEHSEAEDAASSPPAESPDAEGLASSPSAASPLKHPASLEPLSPSSVTPRAQDSTSLPHSSPKTASPALDSSTETSSPLNPLPQEPIASITPPVCTPDTPGAHRSSEADSDS
jgi:hypothetical protein